MNEIKSLIEFVNNNETSELTVHIEQICSRSKDVTGRILCIKLLGWIRRLDAENVRSLKLPSYPWAQFIRDCVNQIEQLSSIFIVKNNELNFSPECSKMDIAHTIALVKQGYQPILLKD